MYQYGKILGQGHHGKVFECLNNTERVLKLSDDHYEWEKESLVLNFFNKHTTKKKTFPKLYLSEKTEKGFLIVMDKIQGVTAQSYLKEVGKKEKRLFGKILLQQILELNEELQPLSKIWKTQISNNDELFKHILTDKWGLIQRTTQGEKYREIEFVVQSLQKSIQKEPEIFIHNDLSFGNTLVKTNPLQISGLVDVGAFGRSRLSLGLYQMTGNWDVLEGILDFAKKTNIFVNEVILFAAATINWAWVTPRLKELGLPNEEKAEENYIKCLEKFHKAYLVK